MAFPNFGVVLALPLDLALAADRALIAPYVNNVNGNNRADELFGRITTLNQDPAGVMTNVHNLNEDYTVDGLVKFRVNSAGSPSFIKFGDRRWNVTAHIGSGAYGAVCRIHNPDTNTFAVLKVQIVENNSSIFNIVNEALIQAICCSLQRRYICNIYGICKKYDVAGRRSRIYYILENLDKTLQQNIQEVGNPPGPLVNGFTRKQVIYGNSFKTLLCGLSLIFKSINLSVFFNHGDLHAKNFVGQKIIDFGFSRVSMTVGGITVVLSASPQFTTTTSLSRDMTRLTYHLWHYLGGDTCSQKAILKNILNFPNPDPGVYEKFESWDRNYGNRPSHKIKIFGGNSFVPNNNKIYDLLDQYNNPNGTFDRVRLMTCPPGVESIVDAEAAGGRRRTRRNKRSKKSKKSKTSKR